MKKYRSELMCFLVFMAFAFTVSAQDDIRTKISKEIVTNLSKGSYTDVQKDFAAVLKPQLPPDKIEEAWKATLKTYGPFDSIIKTAAHVAPGTTYNQVAVRCKFSIDNCTVEATFNEDNKVIALWIKP